MKPTLSRFMFKICFDHSLILMQIVSNDKSTNGVALRSIYPSSVDGLVIPLNIMQIMLMPISRRNT